MLIDRRTWQLHRSWSAVTAGITVAAAFWYAITGLSQGRLPSGSSLPGLTFGVGGGLLVLFECLLWPRKKVRAWRLGSAQVWMRAHIWIGLLCLPVLILHSGFRWGGALSTVLMALLITVVASGLWGLLLQQFVPARLLREAPAESVYEEIDHLAAALVEEADELMIATAGVKAEALPPAAVRHPFTTLAVGFARPLLRRRESMATSSDISLEVEALETFFRQRVRPYLTSAPRSGSVFHSPHLAAAAFEDVRRRVDPSLHASLDALQHLCRQRHKLDVQARLHFWLQNWLWIHLPLSAALVILMFVHAWAAVTYW